MDRIFVFRCYYFLLLKICVNIRNLLSFTDNNSNNDNLVPLAIHFAPIFCVIRFLWQGGRWIKQLGGAAEWGPAKTMFFWGEGGVVVFPIALVNYCYAHGDGKR
jgi:hypothetical protein